jgi:hypothetical protein
MTSRDGTPGPAFNPGCMACSSHHAALYADAPEVDENGTLEEYNAQRQALADYLNDHLPMLRTFGDLQAMLAAADSYYTGVELVSKRPRWGNRRRLFAFSGARPDKGNPRLYGHDPADERTAYLYDDGESHGECGVSRLYTVARWEVWG